MSEGTHIPREELALYAAGALTEDESAEIKVHLQRCGLCREELAHATEDVALLMMSVEEQPLPSGAKQRLMSRVAAAADRQALGGTELIEMPKRRKMAASFWTAWGAAAALLVVSIGLEVKIRDLSARVAQERQAAEAQDELNARARKVLSLLSSENAQRVELTAAKVHPVPSARATYLASQGALVLMANNLPQLSKDKTYELWIIPADGKGPIPAGLLRPDAGGQASVVLPEIPIGVGAKAFGITIEKAGGSDTPTLPILLSGAAPSAGD